MFKPAARAQTKLRMAITGPAGSGKTLSALKIARGLVGPNGKIALIDTENGSASYYAGEHVFDAAQLAPPYLIANYVDAIKQGTEAGYDCLIVDSLSHAWAGEGGLLQRKEALDQNPKSNSFTNWGKFTPEQNKLVNAVLLSKTNIICTMRSKTEYALSKNDSGKQVPQKMGLAPVQREGFDYEFDIVLDIDVDTHAAKASKDRTGIFAKLDPFLVNERAGETIAKWQSSGTPMAPQETKPAEKKADAPHGDFKEAPLTEKKEELKAEAPKRPPNQTPEWLAVGEEIKAAVVEYRWTWDGVNIYVRQSYKKSVAELNLEEMKQLLYHIINPVDPNGFENDSRE